VTGAAGFQWVVLKPDLGALILGILLASHSKSSELAKSLMSLKDLFLVGFFLTIGLSGVPDLAGLGVALLLVLMVPVKVGLFLLLLTRFRLRSRSSLLGSLSLANYSEFGLIVAAVGATNGWIGPEWLVIIASPLNSAADTIYIHWRRELVHLEAATRYPDDQPIDPGEATIGIFGMGRIGTAAYDFMRERYGNKVLGFDFSAEAVKTHRAAGRQVVQGDPTDPDFWARIQPGGKGRLVMLTMTKHAANLAAAKQLITKGFKGGNRGHRPI
jgi:Kef-type K+ transport system membrane component KefB